MDRDEAFQQLQLAVQDPQHGPRQISKLAESGVDLNYSSCPQHPIFEAIGFHHMNIVNVLLENGVRFDHRDPKHHNASVIQRLRSQRDFFQGLADSPAHKESRGVIKRRLKLTLKAIEIYDSAIAKGQLDEIADVSEPTHEEVMKALQERLRALTDSGGNP